MVYCYYNDFNDEVCENSYWDGTGRWILLGVIVGVFMLFTVSYLLFACMTSRRRQKQGMKPYYGTAWAAPPAYSRDDPHPEAKELADSPAPSYQAATTNEEGTANTNANTNVNAGVRGEEYVQDGMNTTSTATGDHGLAMPGQVADPDQRRVHGMV